MCRAIHTAKNSLDLDMDSEVGLNRQRQDLAEVFRHMAMLRNSEKTIAAEAPASDSTARETRSPTDVMPRRSPPSTLTGTRSGAWLRRSARKADEISMSLDKCLVNTEVSYEPPFD